MGQKGKWMRCPLLGGEPQRSRFEKCLDFALNMVSGSCLRAISGQLYTCVGGTERSPGVGR